MKISSTPAAQDYLDALAFFPRYAANAWRRCDGERGYFGDPSHLESGMRTSGNVTFCSALLASDPHYRPLEPRFNADAMLGLARECIRYMTSSHVSGKKSCGDGAQWGEVWQSSWWTTRMALGAGLIWPRLSLEEQADVARVVVREANIFLDRLAPSGLFEDTKAEENAWDCEILATAIAMFPEHGDRPRWWNKLCEYAINVFSVCWDRGDDRMVDGRPLREWSYTVNLHSDFTLENHGSYHFCYVASSLHSLAWASHALQVAGIEPPAALSHHVAKVWNAAKGTFLNRRFAYVGGQDWARYAYGEYFIVPALVWLQTLLQDADAVPMEAARLLTLREEQAANDDGSFFGRRFTQPHYHGQCAKYETDCYANLGLAYLLRRRPTPRLDPPTPDRFQENLSGTLVSPECGIAYGRSPRLFASFSWKSLTAPFPLALFVPIGHDDLAEWQTGNLLGRIAICHREPSAVSIRFMKETATGFDIHGTLAYRNRKGSNLFTHELEFRVDLEAQTARVASRFVAQKNLFVRRLEGLNLALPNDRFNGFVRSIACEQGTHEIRFAPSDSPFWKRKNSLPFRVAKKFFSETLRDGPRLTMVSRWLCVDNVLGIVNLDSRHDRFVVHRPRGRNLANGSLHFDRVCCPLVMINRRFRPGEEILRTEFLLFAGNAAATRKLCQESS